jgi:hypothetical protein
VSVRNFCKNLKRLWSYSLEQDYKAHYERWYDQHQDVSIAKTKLADITSIADKHKQLIAYLVRDIEDLKNAQHKAESDRAGVSRAETPITISINVDGVPVRPKIAGTGR